ncbi:carboxyl transferase domain-containing protein [Streptosporangium sp. NPDC002544]|uniref:acyl-CoA carboxylase subunit beta n=1 Tax=Streptosporangium sp. NPDC002544 TaxID=3154538 RepID=UPI00332BD8D1
MAFTWESALEELRRRHEEARRLGGAERVERQHTQGRQTIRERIGQIADNFTEVGEFATFPIRDAAGTQIGTLPSSYVCGLGTVDGRQVAIGGEDFTVRAGAPQTYLDRWKGGMGGFVEDLAHEYRIPLILFMEGIGGDVSAQDEKGHSYLVSSMSWRRSFELMSQVPVLVAVLGSAAGGTAGRAVVSHFSVISKGSVLFAGGPPVVRRALGQTVDKHELGGAEMHTSVSGAMDNLAEDEVDAIDQLRRVLSYLPQNVWELPARGDRSDPVDRSCDELLKIIPENRRRPYKMREVMRTIVDRDSLFEMGPGWGRAVITAFARIDGIPVGVIGNNPMHLAGALDGAAAEKQIRFVDLCSTFHLPIVYLVDVPGFMVGPEAERRGVVRMGMRAIQSITEAEVPVVTVHVRKAYGMAVSATSNPDALGLRIAWPSSEWGDMPIEGGVEAGFRREIEQAEDPEAFRRQAEERLLALADPWKTVEAFGMEMMIDPRRTRKVVADFLNAGLHAMRSRVGPSDRRWRMRP